MTAAATEAVPVDQLQSMLTCSICLETLNDPRTLPCFHSFCKSCLEKFVRSHREKAVDKVIEEFNCPTCRSVFILKPGEEVSRMASSHFIRNMLDVIAIQRRAKASKCSRCQEPAINRCLTCQMFMCVKCFEAHESWPVNKKHSVLSINELTEPENQAKIRPKLYCEKHENKTLKFYCETCKELICTHCMVLNHVKQNHSCLSIGDVADKQREALRSDFAILHKELTEGNEALEAICNVTEFLENNAKKVKAQVIKEKEEILKAVAHKLEEKAQLIINEVDKIYNIMHNDLSKQRDVIRTYVDKVKSSVDLPRSLLDNGNNEEVVLSQNMIQQNIEKLKNERPKEMKPVHDGKIEYESKAIKDVNATEILDKLGEIAGHPLPGDLSSISMILKRKYQFVSQMKDWLDDKCKWNLCYRASRDGWRAEDFHRCCDNKGPTVTLVRVGNYIFGGYTDQNWAGYGYISSNSSFMFSLQNKENLPPFKAPVCDIEHAINTSSHVGPIFGGGYDLCIVDNPHISRESTTNFGHSYKLPEDYSYRNKKTLLAGSYRFTPNEIEVFY